MDKDTQVIKFTVGSPKQHAALQEYNALRSQGWDATRKTNGREVTITLTAPKVEVK